MDWNHNNKISNEENKSIHLEYWLTNDNRDNGTQEFKMNDNFIQFGVCKRDCVGTSLELKSMYATFGLMMNKYRCRAKVKQSLV